MSLAISEPAVAHCAQCGRAAPDGHNHAGVGVLCEQCEDLRHDALLDWYDSR